MLATAVASLFLGNYARDTLAPKVDDYLGKLIEHMAFIAKSLVFLLAGLLFANSGVNLAQLWLPIAITVLVVAAARMISVYAVDRKSTRLNSSHVAISYAVFCLKK